MISLRTLSIPRKIVAISMIISGSALLLASGALLTYDYIAARRELRSNAASLARVIADNLSAAVAFNDQNAAMDTLNGLRAEPSVVSGCIYSATTLFAQHLSDAQNARCPPNPVQRPENGLVLVSAPIELRDKQIGTVQLRATLGPAYVRLRMEVVIIAAILLLAAVFAFAMSARLHKVVSQPILSLARTADEVSHSKDYSIRAERESEDEMATLVESFNEMLTQIQARENVLEDRTAALAKANEDLQNASKMKDEFLATLSHELRTPLTSVFGWIHLLRSGGLDEEKKAKALDVIDRNVRVQIQLVDDLLNVSQIITGKLKIGPEWTDAAAIVRAAVDSIQPAAAAKDVRIVSDVADPADQIFADSERIQQVLWNLLTNAIRFTEKGGEIDITCGRVDGKFQISVSDTGEGIDPEFMPFLFERFTQADASRTRRHGGLGLGLAIARHIAEAHGGTLQAFSKGKGQGATFTLRLPVPSPQSKPILSVVRERPRSAD